MYTHMYMCTYLHTISEKCSWTLDGPLSDDAQENFGSEQHAGDFVSQR